MAGLYETNLHANFTGFAILTTATDGELREVHDRKHTLLSGEAPIYGSAENCLPMKLLSLPKPADCGVVCLVRSFNPAE